ncbi:RNA polymerase sigma factor [Candidatus Woesearchaeota archaeon]|nr:RNA polymerase sigma factor [Candidatus Woesearchaeota archaeon]
MTTAYISINSDLATRIAEGDHDALGQLYRQHAARLFTTVYYRLPERERYRAEDIVQEAFLKLWEHRDGLDPDSNIEGYLYTTARNLVCNVQRREYIVRFSSLDEMSTLDNGNELPLPVTGDAYAPDSITVQAEIRAKVERALEQLPAHYRQALTLVDVQERSYQEVAEMLGVPQGTLKSRLSRARKAVQTDLTRRGISPELFER